MLESSITIEEYAPDILIMRWEPNVQSSDILNAFQEIKYCLDSAQQENISIIIDISANPDAPLNQALFEALDIQHHNNFHEWLILGKNEATQADANIRWFGSLDDLNQYLPCFAPSQFVFEMTQFNSCCS